MKKCLLLLLLILLTACLPIMATASDVSLANYEATVTISNNSTATTNVAVPFTLNSTSLIAAGYIDTACTRVAMTDSTDVVFMPGYAGNPWVVFVPSIGADATVRDSLYTSNTSLSSTKSFFGTLSIADHASLEPLNYTCNLSMMAFVKTSVAGALFVKNVSNIYPRSDGSGNIVITDVNSTANTLTYAYSGGYHWYQVVRGGGTLQLYIDGVSVASIACGNNDTDYGDAWQIGSAATMYITSANITINGVLKGSYAWNYGATITDLSGNGRTATPTFRTTTSDADVSATISSFSAIGTATAPAYTVTDQGTFYTGNITATGNFTSNTTMTGGPAVLDVVEDLANAGSIPPSFLWGIIGCVVCAASGLSLSYARKKFNIGGGYVFALLIIGIIVFALLIAFKKFDPWMLWFYIIIAGGIAMASRHIDWGGGTSQHSLIGFLAMAWIGLTLINRILEGTFITAAETSYLNTVTFTKAFSLLNLFTIPIMNWDFFTVGIPSLLRWDYSFFGGQAQIVQYMLYSITAVVSFIIFGIILGLVYSAITRST